MHHGRSTGALGLAGNLNRHVTIFVEAAIFWNRPFSKGPSVSHYGWTTYALALSSLPPRNPALKRK
jgi:hypothetical protein